MLSKSIRALRDSLAKYEEDGVSLAPQAVEAFTRMLTSFAAEAVTLEAAASVAGDLFEPARAIAAKLAQLGVRVGMPTPPDRTVLFDEANHVAE